MSGERSSDYHFYGQPHIIGRSRSLGHLDEVLEGIQARLEVILREDTSAQSPFSQWYALLLNPATLS